jgi:hypothetical protein
MNGMVHFLQENGFPMTLHLDTNFEFEDKENEFKGHYTTITDDAGNVVGEFAHTDLRARIHWVNGFYTALRREKNLEIPLSIN